MGKKADNRAKWILVGITAVCLTLITMTVVVVTAPVTVSAGVGAAVGVGGVSGTAYIITQKK